MKRIHNRLVILLIFALLLSLAAPVGAAGSRITIRTPEDLVELSRRCSLDSWSRGKTVVLSADLDLSDVEFSSIPTFGGTFDGQGYTISGLTITGSGNVRGLFRYLQSGGVVQNVSLEVTIEPTDLQDSLGGLVGNNRGSVRNCTVTGSIQGETNIGGIIGVNESSGKIINSTFSGSVTGEHYVGGIAGQNLGSILQCVNQGKINTVAVEGEADLEDLDSRPLNSTENLPACTDIGGITGFSTGVLQSCKNTGPVGYEHVGYNVGGIAGRQSGYLNGCTNQGVILGRKDVGGIAGQLEPEIFLRYGEDLLNQLWSELGTLGDQVDHLLSDLNSTNTSTTAQLQTLSSHAGTAQDAAGELMDAAKDWANGNLSTVNDLSARISWSLQQLEPILETLRPLPEELTDAVDALEEGLDQAEQAGDLASDAGQSLRTALQEALRAADHMNEGLEHIRASQDALKSALGNPNEIKLALEQMAKGIGQLGDGTVAFSEAMEHLRDGWAALPDVSSIDAFLQAFEDLSTAGTSTANGLKNIQKAFIRLKDTITANGDPTEALKTALQELEKAAASFQSGADQLQTAGKHLLSALDTLEDAGIYLDGVVDAFRDAGDAFNNAFSRLGEGADAFHEMVKTLAEEPSIQFTPIGSDMTARGDTLDAALSDLLGSADDLGDLLSQSSDTILGDLSAVSQQLQSITDLLRQETSLKKSGEGDRIEDISDQVDGRSQRTGCLSDARNEGVVKGDVNVAGIAGSMAIEYDFDPEDDLVEVGDRSLDVRYQTKAVILSCINLGEVTGKKDDAGGIVGRMDLGQVSHCENYGSVSSADGSYVGGIAGASWGSIRDSWARCTLSGDHYVGGIAGYGSTLKNCHTLITLQEGSAYVGTVAGSVDPEGTVTGNTFTQEDLGAIDGISYAGQAEPVTFGALCAAGAPETFAQLELTFRADGKEVAVVPFQYGKGIARLPEIPAKKGYSAAWPDLDYSHLTASQTLEAIYTPYTSSLTDGGDLPDILVDGSFSAQAKVSHTTKETAWTDSKGESHQGTAYTVTVKDPVLDAVSYTVHCRLPEANGRYAVWVQTGENWQRQDSEKDGSYLLFPSTEETITFCLVEEGNSLVKYLLTFTVLAAGLFILFWRRRMQKKKEHAQQPPASSLESKE
ncbi:GLUG motif-containing protein [Evtepia gabavorous]|uniref:GLUG motif-containing protein n=1 Tax=Evtepia gabavorous TaxID=2211183 RepID=UPI003A947F66